MMVNCEQYELKMSLSDISPKSSPVYGSFNYLRFSSQFRPSATEKLF